MQGFDEDSEGDDDNLECKVQNAKCFHCFCNLQFALLKGG